MDTIVIYGQVCFDRQLIAGSVKYVQASTEAVGLLVGLFKATDVSFNLYCFLGHWHLLYWHIVRPNVSTGYLNPPPTPPDLPSTHPGPLYVQLMIFPELEKLLKNQQIQLAAGYINVQWKIVNCICSASLRQLPSSTGEL